jgi:hypothetical protein
MTKEEFFKKRHDLEKYYTSMLEGYPLCNAVFQMAEYYEQLQNLLDDYETSEIEK